MEAVAPRNDPWARWPRTHAALLDTYFKVRAMPERYLLAGLQRMYETACAVHGRERIDYRRLDAAAAAECYYHDVRGRVFGNPEAALSTCWRNLVTERPEKILPAAQPRNAAINRVITRL